MEVEEDGSGREGRRALGDRGRRVHGGARAVTLTDGRPPGRVYRTQMVTIGGACPFRRPEQARSQPPSTDCAVAPRSGRARRVGLGNFLLEW
eukprot:CAMPEP_0184718218 /NCGR_PEP_ID=MMETSP0314-20130426/7480_1 /TAXON_ID=38298 /ORGANISM="Rhodella maculata, Strain CCMP 736" /LENGTH=91 /DNA_ID=CAMNT_0027181925 /DNA_START=51 /DNA_END=327 /DNA_ORIENTATION=+